MFDKARVRGLLAPAMLLIAGGAMADTFGTGASQFTISFVPISGATNPTSGYGIVNHDYRIGTYEVTNDQWNKFTASLGVPVTGSEGGYGIGSWFTGTNVPADRMNWYAAAQFVNWLNTTTGHQPAYKFTGTQGLSTYTFVPWSSTDAGYDASNPFRNTAAYYFLPTEDEWVKAAYWNGTALQTWATTGDLFPAQGNGISGTGWNYVTSHFATNPDGPWAVGSGSQEINGTYDMMGNDWEWMESPWTSGVYGAGSSRGLGGGSWASGSDNLGSSCGGSAGPTYESFSLGFRVTSVPEPGSLAMLLGFALATLLHCWRRHT
jgi:formylglycine-generating enzyme required for sulfatase activity